MKSPNCEHITTFIANKRELETVIYINHKNYDGKMTEHRNSKVRAPQEPFPTLRRVVSL